MEYHAQFQISSILNEIEYMMDLLGSTLDEPARNALLERMGSMIRSMAEITASQVSPKSRQGDVKPQAEEPPSQPVASPLVSGGRLAHSAVGTKRVLTHGELALYNGTNGYPAYVAVNGIVYDVTDDPIWYTLTHFGLPPGRDLSMEFNTCHSNKPFILDDMIPVGRLESGEEQLI